MKIYDGFSDKRLKKKERSVAIGIFDGVHRAHRRILERVVREARKSGAVPAVVTFDPHPQKVLSGDRKNPPILMSLEHRLRVIASLGVREAIVVKFDRKFAGTPRERFLEDLLVGRAGMRFLGVGHDFRFGKGAQGTVGYLRARSKALGFRIFECKPLKQRGHVISSTAIRRRIEQGRLKEAATMLGRPVSLYGTVIRGHGRGRKIGFPTANLDPHHETLPPEGVYAARGDAASKRIRGVVHIGKRPTFGEKEPSVEVHVFDWKKPLYGREIELFFIRKLRPVRRFAGSSELVRAIRTDIRRARRIFSLQG
jgi:riboflavin kinase / FMN adenylyltransferase